MTGFGAHEGHTGGEEEVTVLCAGCIGFQHCDGREGGCDCTCGLSPDWADGWDDGWDDEDEPIPPVLNDKAAGR